MTTTFFQDFPNGITCIDTNYIRSGFAASYLLVEAGEAVFIETGPRLAVATLLDVLAQKKLSPAAVKAIIVTHIHLDHAGGAGELLHHLPNATLWVHPRGLRHLLEPHKLQASAEAVYGKQRFQAMLGGITPASAQRTMATEDHETFFLQGRALTLLHTPGHALHHQCVWDSQSGGLFSGDAFGISYRIFDQEAKILLFPSTTPVQFDLQASHRTLDRLADLQPKWLFLTHFGRVRFTQNLTTIMHQLLEAFATLARDPQHPNENPARLAEALQHLLSSRLQASGRNITTQEICDWLALDCTINAQGLKLWMERLP